MKTHIIIPIADIENEINANREYPNLIHKNATTLLYIP